MNRTVFTIDGSLLGNDQAIDARIDSLPEAEREAVRHTLRYLYIPDGPVALSREYKLIAEPHLDAVEHFRLQWLFKRTNGKLRNHYGRPALIAARRASYQCVRCGFNDVRALNLERIPTTSDSDQPEFECICANCNIIAARSREMAQIAADRSKVMNAEEIPAQSTSEDAISE